MAETKKKYCDDCPRFKKMEVYGGLGNDKRKYYNTYCQMEVPLLIDVRVKERLTQIAPEWCPNCTASASKPKEYKVQVAKTPSWLDVPIKEEFSKLTFGTTYHIPPFGKSKRMDVRLTGKSPASIWCKHVLPYNGKDSAPNIMDNAVTIYPNSTIAHVIVKNRLPSFYVPNMFSN